MSRLLNPLKPVLFLDFDGVLHPDDVYRIRGKIVLQRDCMSLFEWAPILEEHLVPYPDLQMVLSTSWVRVLGFRKVLKWLPEGVRKRVVGATWHSAMDQYEWRFLTRCEQIVRYATRHRLSRWCAVDDDCGDWMTEYRGHVVETDPDLGIAHREAQDALRGLLRTWAE